MGNNRKNTNPPRLVRDANGITLIYTRKPPSTVEVRMPYKRAICDMWIDDIGLSVRARNCLRRAGIRTMEQLIEAVSRGEIENIHYLGRNSLREIKSCMFSLSCDNMSLEEKRSFLRSAMSPD